METQREIRPYLEKYPTATVEDLLRKLVTASNWYNDQYGISPAKRKRKLQAALWVTANLEGIELRKREGKNYIRAYDPETKAITFKELTLKEIMPYAERVAYQSGLYHYVLDDPELIPVAIERLFRYQPDLSQ